MTVAHSENEQIKVACYSSVGNAKQSALDCRSTNNKIITIMNKQDLINLWTNIQQSIQKLKQEQQNLSTALDNHYTEECNSKLLLISRVIDNADSYDSYLSELINEYDY